LAQQGSTSTPYQWIGNEGYYLNADVGFYLLGVRFYSPILGRFITRDPLGFYDAQPNHYCYVLNQTTVASDPSGKVSTQTRSYACLQLPARCHGSCTCTWQRGALGLAAAMISALYPCCQFSCLCGFAGGTPTQASAMARCMNTYVRSLGGAKAAPTSCSCT